MKALNPVYLALLLLVLGLAACNGGGSTAAGPTTGGEAGGPVAMGEVLVKHTTGILSRARVTDFYMRPAGSGPWGENLLGTALLGGETVQLADMPAGAYDVMARGIGGNLEPVEVIWLADRVLADDQRIYEVLTPGRDWGDLLDFDRGLPGANRFPMEGEQGPVRVKSGRGFWMTTRFTLGNTGLVVAETEVKSTEFLVGFTGSVRIVFYDEDSNPVAATRVMRFGVNANTKRTALWQDTIPADVARERVVGYQIMQIHDPRNRLTGAEVREWLETIGKLVTPFLL